MSRLAPRAGGRPDPKCSANTGRPHLPAVGAPLAINARQEGSLMRRRIGVFVYGVGVYTISLVIFAYLAGFLVNIGVPRAIDSEREGSLAAALAIDLALLAVFGVQHSVMARPAFKRWWTQFVPAEAERSTYMLASNAALALLFWQWRPIGGVVWDTQGTPTSALFYAGFAVGWVVLL